MLLALGLFYAGSLHCKPHDQQKNSMPTPACIKCLLFDQELGFSLPSNWHLRFRMGHLAWSFSAPPIKPITDHPQPPSNNATTPSMAQASGEL